MSPTLKSTGGGSIWAKISLGVDPWCLGLQSEHPRLTNGEIISGEFQPMWSQSTNVTDGRTGQTDGQTDDMRSKDRALHSSASRGNITENTRIQKLIGSKSGPSPVPWKAVLHEGSLADYEGFAWFWVYWVKDWVGDGLWEWRRHETHLPL